MGQSIKYTLADIATFTAKPTKYENCYCLFLFLTTPFFLSAQFLTNYLDPNGEDVSFSAITEYQSHAVAIGTAGNKLLVAEIDTNGIIVTTHTIILIDESLTPICNYAITDTDGMIAMAGFRGTVGTVATYNAFVLRYDLSANSVKWLRVWQTVPSPYGAYFTKIIESDNIYLVSGSFSDSPNGQMGIIGQVNKSNGSMVIKTLLNYNNSADDFASFCVIDGKQLTWGRNNLSGGGFDLMRPCISVLSSNGSEINSYAYIRSTSTAARLYGTDITVLNSTAYAIAFGDNSGIQLDKDFYLLKVKKTGVISYTKKLEFDADYDGRLQAIGNNGSRLFIYGNKYDASAPNLTGDAFIINLAANGNPSWVKSYPFTSCQTGGAPGAMFVSSNSVWAVGRSFDDVSGQYQGTILRVSTATGDMNDCDVDEFLSVNSETNQSTSIDMIDETTTDVLKKKNATINNFSLKSIRACAQGIAFKANEDANENDQLLVYPNPLDQSATIEFNLENSGAVVINLYDMTGREIRNLADETLSEGTYNFTLSREGLSSGVYLMSLRIDDQQPVNKMVIIK